MDVLGAAGTKSIPDGIVFSSEANVAHELPRVSVRRDAEWHEPPNPYLSSSLKRILDVLVAAVLIAFFLPLCLVIALAIRTTSPGPAIFRQDRGGRHGVPFTIWKFRTMYVEADDGSARQVTQGDDRITRIGRLLRMTSADELPQLVNVLRGDMSIVGPRPHALRHDQFYGSRIARYTERLHAKPGLTGLAQIHNLRGPTPTVESMQHRVDKDLDYVDRASLRLDLQILVRTVLIVVSCRNAL